MAHAWRKIKKSVIQRNLQWFTDDISYVVIVEPILLLKTGQIYYRSKWPIFEYHHVWCVFIPRKSRFKHIKYTYATCLLPCFLSRKQHTNNFKCLIVTPKYTKHFIYHHSYSSVTILTNDWQYYYRSWRVL